MFVTALVALLTAISVPQVTTRIDYFRARAAAAYLAHQCAAARFRAINTSRTVALRFTPAQDDYELQLFADGNRNGVRTQDIQAGVDPPLAGTERLGIHFPGVRIAIAPEHDLGRAAVRLGGTTLLSFTPAGTATSGSVYVSGRDGTQFVVRVLGATGRTRVQRYAPNTRTWVTP